MDMDARETAQVMDLAVNHIHGLVAEAREAHGCSTTHGLLAMAYRLEWFPTDREKLSLSRLAGGPITGPGYIRNDGSFNPHTRKSVAA